jgi:hypothetical protein
MLSEADPIELCKKLVDATTEETTMKGKIAAGFIAVMMFVTVVGLATAQNTTKATHRKTRTLTGCLQKGEGGDEYNLTTKGGATWEIKSDSVKLDDHLGHTVAVTGVVSHHKAHAMKEDAKTEMKEHGIDKDAKEHGHMTVTALKMVSDSCQK